MRYTYLPVCFLFFLVSCQGEYTQNKDTPPVTEQEEDTESVSIDEKIEHIKNDEEKAKTQKENRIENATQKIEIDPNKSQYYLDRGEIYFEYNEYELAKLDYEKALEIGIEDVENISYIGSQYVDMGEKERGIEIQKIALDQEKNSDIIYYNLARTYYYALGDYQQALIYIDNALKIKEDFDGYNLKGGILDMLEDYEGSLQAYEEAKKFNTNKDMLFYNIGITYYHLGEYKKAIENFKEGQRYISQESYDFYTRIAYAYWMLDDYENTIDSIHLAAENDPYSPEIYYLSGLYYLEIKNYEATKKYFQKFIDEVEDIEYWEHKIYIAQYNIGVAEYYLGNYEIALKITNTLIEQEPSDPDLYDLKDHILQEME